MLVLMRRIGEAIKIDDHTTVKVLDIQGRQVRLGIRAPKNISVHREEVYERIEQQKREQADH